MVGLVSWSLLVVADTHENVRIPTENNAAVPDDKRRKESQDHKIRPYLPEHPRQIPERRDGNAEEG